MINLLPPKIKREQKLGQISSQINTAVLALLIMIALTYTAIYFVNFFLSSQMIKNNELLNKTNVEIARLKPIQESLVSTNQKISKIEQIKNQRFEWSAVLADLNNSIPAQIKVDSMQLDKTNSKLTLSAAAETRSDIVKLQAKLEDLPYFKNMSFQSSNFDDNNVYFTFSMTGTISK